MVGERIFLVNKKSHEVKHNAPISITYNRDLHKFKSLIEKHWHNF